MHVFEFLEGRVGVGLGRSGVGWGRRVGVVGWGKAG